MCRNYHRVRTSSSFVTLWNGFIKRTSHAQPQPTFYQEVTDIVFEGIIASALPVHAATVSEAAFITCDDSNVINYATIFFCHKIHNSIFRSFRPDKLELLGCVKALLQEDDEEGISPSAAWVTEVDRGGFWYVQEATYMLFAAIEEEVREHIRVGAVENTQEGCRKILITAVSTNDKVFILLVHADSRDRGTPCRNCP